MFYNFKPENILSQFLRLYFLLFMQFLCKKKKTLLVLVVIQKQQKYKFKEQCLLIEFYIELNNFIY